MKNAVVLTLLWVLTTSPVTSSANGPKLVGEKAIMKLDDNIAYRETRGVFSMRLSPDGRRVLYLHRKIYKATDADGSQRDRPGYKLVLRDLKTGKDTAVPVPAVHSDDYALAWLSMTVFDPTGKTLIVPAGRDANKNDFMEETERCKAGFYDIASGKLKTLDVEGNMTLPTFGPSGKTLLVLTVEGAGTPTGMKIHITPTDKIKFRRLSKAGLIRSVSPTSDLVAMLLITEGMPGRCVLYDVKTDTVNGELIGKRQSPELMEYNPQWTGDGRYVYHIITNSEVRDGRSYRKILTRIWDVKAGKEVSLLSDVAPIGPGSGKGTMVLVRIPSTPSRVSGVREIFLHAQDDKTLGQKLHPLGDASMRPISTQGKWLLFIRKDADGKEKACLAEIVLPKK